ncbi:hypothetical protein [Amycolatopsis sp. NPDC004079]|uniref:hypothetical protein n=1 Tax=Amycolatopsis sp. NPDC004079 TaxID=3154549 RepID=UPI0033AF0FF0
MKDRTVSALALFATLQAAFSDVHPYCDQVLQDGQDACDKSKPGAVGRKACARHVASYAIGQLGVAVAVTRVLGARVSWPGLLAGTAINAVTHYAIDRREPLKKFLLSDRARKLHLVGGGKAGYLAHATAQRRPGVVDESGPGTALAECDQAVHRLIGVFASLVATWLAVRGSRQR